MIELAHRLAEPAELRQHRTANPGGTWNDAEFGAVKPIVRHQLNREQEGLCVYCETELGEDEGHVEHIKSKGLNPPLTFVYDNLAHSCNGPTIGPGHCGHRKKRQVLTIEPRPGCNRFFSVMILDGRVPRLITFLSDDTKLEDQRRASRAGPPVCGPLQRRLRVPQAATTVLAAAPEIPGRVEWNDSPLSQSSAS